MSDEKCAYCGADRTGWIDLSANAFQGYYYFECGTHGNSRGEKCKHATKMIAKGYAQAEKDIAARLRRADTEPLKDGEDRITGNLMIEMGSFGMIADWILRGGHRSST
jgi:hypothetical protein